MMAVRSTRNTAQRKKAAASSCAVPFSGPAQTDTAERPTRVMRNVNTSRATTAQPRETLLWWPGVDADRVSLDGPWTAGG